MTIIMIMSSFCELIYRGKCGEPYFQPKTLKELLTNTDLRLCKKKQCTSNKQYTVVPLLPLQHVLLIFCCIFNQKLGKDFQCMPKVVSIKNSGKNLNSPSVDGALIISIYYYIKGTVSEEK